MMDGAAYNFQPGGYAIDLAHVKTFHPAIPDNVLGYDLTQPILRGTRISPADQKLARETTQALCLAQTSGRFEDITPEVVQTAQSRELAIGIAHANSLFPVDNTGMLAQIANQLTMLNGRHDEMANRFNEMAQNTTNRFNEMAQNMTNRFDQMSDQVNNRFIQMEAGINGRLDQIETNLCLLNARTDNTYRLKLNNKSVGGILPLRKTVAGGGYQAALQTTANWDQGRRNQFHQLFANQPVATIGDLPPGFVINLEGYTHLQILGLITFYNDDYGIQPGDDHGERLRKLRAFFRTYQEL